MQAVNFHARQRSRLRVALPRLTLLLQRMSRPRHHWKNTHTCTVHRARHKNQRFDNNTYARYPNDKIIPANNNFDPNPTSNFTSYLPHQPHHHPNIYHDINLSNNLNDYSNRIRKHNIHIHSPRLDNRDIHHNRALDTNPILLDFPPHSHKHRNRPLHRFQRAL
jgi:hypothetical protein